MTIVFQRQRDVVHGQAGAQQEDSGIRRNAPKNPGLPGITDVARVRMEFLQGRRSRGGKIAGRDDGARRLQLLAIIQGEEHLAAVHAQVHHLAAQAGKADLGIGTGNRLFEPGVEVVAIQASREEIARTHIGRPGTSEFEEVPRLIGKQAHALGRDIEDMAG
ncbi:hypothetical protein D9M71_516870 [compost metagenome]